ncbi:beta-ketoacyl-ACP synthase II [Candidatus Nitronereus thalassa]|uniref:3-oxoacyl-[acyl-carrier-protein] synthase 2 n=1 Tax=Candidatus Nitronereus thalassa TaxID=3020898 RepID=A0ABU3K4H8_9BACT|nr:beta-ketoacyl-ACP synthase II [Candidatus Nitronereus thalassa]MDT7041270.1 beta-ketoacyl-ACP synthase II [Candidatus Nitronereus thalassa]
MAPTVVVTGLGIITPIGIGLNNFWNAAIEGRSGISKIPSFEGLPIDAYRSRIAGQIHDFDPLKYIDEKYANRVDRYAQLGLVAAKEAIEDAGVDMERENADRVGVMVGAGMGGMMMGEREISQLYDTKKPNRVHPNFIPTITLNSASGIIAMAFGARGPNITISTACSSSIHAIGQAMHALRMGKADMMITAGADASITPLVFAGFCSLRALSSRYNDQPTQASRPFDRGRDGFVMGEGAGALILETLQHAKRRRARIYAEVAGYASTSEAYHMVVPKEDGMEIAKTMKLALDDAKLRPAQVDYVNAHATSTLVGDDVEVRGLRHIFKSRANKLKINATKSLVGHTLGAAGALGAITSIMALKTGIVHPTLNLDDPDPECKLDGISSKTQEGRFKVAMANAFGFGSNNGVLVLKKFPTR